MSGHLKIVSAFMLILLSASPLGADIAHGDVIYTVTATGVINEGTSDGTFGPAGSSLFGQSFSISQTFDASVNTDLVSSPGDNNLYTGIDTTIITIGAFSIIMSSNRSINIVEVDGISISSSSEGNNVPNFISDRTTSNGFNPSIEIILTGNGGLNMPFLPNDFLYQSYYYSSNPPTQDSSGEIIIGLANDSDVDGYINTLSLNGGAPVPEPAPISLFVVALAGIFWLSRSRSFGEAITLHM